jgi:butyryl-CoA dehydrogenase
MKPFSGGIIDNAAVALKYVLSQTGIVVLAGVERKELLNENWEIFQGSWKINEREAARFLVYNAAYLAFESKPYSKNAAMAKLYASELAMRASTWGIQIFGGYGYMMEYPMQRFFRDAKLTEIYEGTSEIQRIVISRTVLG